MKVVFVNRYFHPDISATSQLLTDLACHLAARGHQVAVICSRQMYEDAHAKLAAHDTFAGITVHRVWTSRFGRGSLQGRACDYLSFYLSAFWQMLRLLDRSTLVVAKTDPPLIAVPVALAARIKGARLVNWVQDLFPEVAQQLGMRSMSGPAGKLLRAIRNATLGAAETNVVLGIRMARRLVGLGTAQQRLQIIPNWSIEDAGPTAGSRVGLGAQWGLAGKFVVMYSGNMGRAHEFDTQLDAATLLQDDDAIRFLWVGGGAQKSRVEAAMAQRGLHNALIKPYQPREHLHESLSVGDLHVISLRPELEGLIVPSKLYGVLSAGRPVLFIGAADGEIAQLVAEHDIGCVIAQGDAEMMASAIRRYATDSALLSRQMKNARRLSETTLSRTSALCRWHELVERLQEDSPR